MKIAPWKTRAMITTWRKEKSKKHKHQEIEDSINSGDEKLTSKEVYVDEMCEEIMDLQRKGKYDLVY